MDTQPSPQASYAIILQIVTWLLMVVSGFAFLARISTKWAMTKALNGDDIASVVSLVCNFGAGASVTILAFNGLGEDQTTLNESKFLVFQKSLYALQLLYIATLCFAKLSVILLIRMISPRKLHQQFGLAIGVFIAAWGFVSLIAASFPCDKLPAWEANSKSCYDKIIFWRIVGGFNIITDIFLVALPLLIVYRLHTDLRKKIIVISCFGSRSFDIVATACQLAYTNELQSSNITSDIFPWILSAQIVQTISIITSCIPYLRPLLDAFPSGMMVNDDLNRHGTSSNYLNGYTKRSDHNYVLREVNNTSKGENSQSTTRLHDSDEHNIPDLTGREVQNSSRIVSERALFKNGPGIEATTTIETAWNDRSPAATGTS